MCTLTHHQYSNMMYDRVTFVKEYFFHRCNKYIKMVYLLLMMAQFYVCVYIYVGSGWMDGWMGWLIDGLIDFACLFVFIAFFLLSRVFLQVQGTNDSSVVSKVSAAAQGYFHDDFLQHFVCKVARRAPLINRSGQQGSWDLVIKITPVLFSPLNT